MNKICRFTKSYFFLGDLQFSRRIVGGNPIKINATPYQASLQNLRGHKCGCTIIDKSYVLTSAHCLDEYVFALDFVLNHFKFLTNFLSHPTWVEKFFPNHIKYNVF